MSYSPHIATKVHELCQKSFGQNCSTSSTGHVHDIHGDISVGSCDPIRVYTLVYEIESVGKIHPLFERIKLVSNQTSLTPLLISGC